MTANMMASQLIRSFVVSGNVEKTCSVAHEFTENTTKVNLTLPGKLNFQQEYIESTLLKIAATMCPVISSSCTF